MTRSRAILAMVAMSVSYEGEISEEDRADEIVKDVIGPVYDSHVSGGKLVSWGWMEHIIGGEYRRIATMTAEDFPALLEARPAIIGDLRGKHQDALDDFNEICDSHQDVLWEIVFESP